MVINIGQDCWNIINEYKKQMEFYEDLSNKIKIEYDKRCINYNIIELKDIPTDLIINNFEKLYFKYFKKHIIDIKNIDIEAVYFDKIYFEIDNNKDNKDIFVIETDKKY